MKRKPLSVEERRAIWRAAAAKAVATRRARLLAGPAALLAPAPIIAGHRRDYSTVDTATLLSLLPGEQAYLDVHIKGMQARLAFVRLDLIERELAARNVPEAERIAWRFGAADHDSEAAAIAERLAIQAEPDQADSFATSFNVEEFAA